jgi:type VI secretion system secreted protein Hcp
MSIMKLKSKFSLTIIGLTIFILTARCAAATTITDITSVENGEGDVVKTPQPVEEDSTESMELTEPMQKVSGYLKLGDIKGESTDNDHKDWIVIESMSSPLSPEETETAGSMSGERVMNPTFGVGLGSDESSDELRRLADSGEIIPEVEIDVEVLHAAGAETTYLKYKLTNVIVTSVSASGSGGDVPVEEVTLTYQKISWDYSEDSTSTQPTLNPDILNPDILNPDIGNPDIGNPDILNPATLIDSEKSDTVEEAVSLTVYLNIEGVKGDVTAKGHEDWIEILSFNSGLSREETSSSGSRESSAPSVSEFTLVKAVDGASPLLSRIASTGSSTTKAEIEFVEVAGGGDTYFRYELTDVIITSVRPVTTGGSTEVAMEEISLSFSRISWELTSAGAEAGKGGNVEYSWDIMTNKGV